MFGVNINKRSTKILGSDPEDVLEAEFYLRAYPSL